MPTEKPMPPEKPRMGRNSESPGSYLVSLRLSTPVINPGDKVMVQLFISGYGNIDGGKLFCSPSDKIFDPTASKIISDLKSENEIIFWGANERYFSIDGVVIGLKGVKFPSWKSSTPFFDVPNSSNDSPTTFTEILTYFKQDPGRAPINFELQTFKSIKPGKYSLDIVFTYFNGVSWVSQTKPVEFTVQNFLERHATGIGVIGIIATVIGLIYAVIPFVKFILKLFS